MKIRKSEAEKLRFSFYIIYIHIVDIYLRIYINIYIHILYRHGVTAIYILYMGGRIFCARLPRGKNRPLSHVKVLALLVNEC